MKKKLTQDWLVTYLLMMIIGILLIGIGILAKNGLPMIIGSICTGYSFRQLVDGT
jgi:hypothetical protein